METTRLSSKGQVIIPKGIRDGHGWEAGQEFTVVDAGDGILLRPKAAFAPTRLDEVAGMLRHKVTPKTDAEIAAGLLADIRRRWRGDD